MPWISWLSPAFEQQSHIHMACLAKLRDQKLSHDNYFHSTLGLLGVQTRVYDAARDIHAGCHA